MAGSKKKKDRDKKQRQKNRRPLSLELDKKREKKSASKTAQPNLRVLRPGSSQSEAQPAGNPSINQGPDAEDPNVEKVHFYIRHHERVEMDILVSTMRFKWGLTEEQTWAAVQKLQAQRAVKVLYPNNDRSQATVSALWLK